MEIDANCIACGGPMRERRNDMDTASLLSCDCPPGKPKYSIMVHDPVSVPPDGKERNGPTIEDVWVEVW